MDWDDLFVLSITIAQMGIILYALVVMHGLTGPFRQVWRWFVAMLTLFFVTRFILTLRCFEIADYRWAQYMTMGVTTAISFIFVRAVRHKVAKRM